MKLSAREQYGLRAMIELAHRYGEGPVSLNEVAQAQGISFPYLEQIVPLLKDAGLIESTRGAYGGYVLSQDPHKITVGDIVRALEEGYIMPLKCIPSAGESDSCARQDICIARDVWKRMHDGIVEVLDSTTLADLMEPAETS
jgi:Rrf2 family cysteine metabolism transcriptional repressor